MVGNHPGTQLRHVHRDLAFADAEEAADIHEDRLDRTVARKNDIADLAGGVRDKLLAATPLLMVVQILLLPLYLLLMAGPAVVGAFDLRPFVEAFLLLIALPVLLVAGALTGVFSTLSLWAALAAGTLPALAMLGYALFYDPPVAYASN